MSEVPEFLKRNLHKYVDFGFLLYRGLIVLIMKVYFRGNMLKNDLKGHQKYDG